MVPQNIHWFVFANFRVTKCIIWGNEKCVTNKLEIQMVARNNYRMKLKIV